jgi:hypothetical protein
MSRAAVAAVAGLLSLAPIGPASADQPLPTWGRYHADRTIQVGWIALALGDGDRAEELSLAAVALDRAHIEAWRLRTATLVAAKNWTDASAAALELTGLAPDDLDAALMGGRISLELGVRASAVAEFQRAGRMDVGDPRPELGLAMTAARLDQDWEAFATHLRTARQRFPGVDLASLPLQDGWASVADDEAFLAALTEVLQAK